MRWHIGMNPGPIVYGEQGEQIADCSSITNFDADNQANARLIAALPELLMVADMVLQTATIEMDENLIKMAHEALNKAVAK